jgi:hypothetical protein
VEEGVKGSNQQVALLVCGGKEWCGRASPKFAVSSSRWPYLQLILCPRRLFTLSGVEDVIPGPDDPFYLKEAVWAAELETMTRVSDG